jgi:hypothetical protein
VKVSEIFRNDAEALKLPRAAPKPKSTYVLNFFLKRVIIQKFEKFEFKFLNF